MWYLYEVQKHAEWNTLFYNISGVTKHTSVEERVGAAIGKGCTFADNVKFHKVYNGYWGVLIFLNQT